jgi:hypothetical protein
MESGTRTPGMPLAAQLPIIALWNVVVKVPK